MMGVEEWRPAYGLWGYEVSSLGNVRSWRTRTGNRVADQPHPVGGPDARGYRVTTPSRSIGEVKIHRLVAETFIGPAPFTGALVRHLNDVKDDNRPENLAWGTDADNTADKMRNGNAWSPGPRKLTWDDVDGIRIGASLGAPAAQLARRYGCSESNIRSIVKGVTWKSPDRG